jgi:hypothetical protein
MTLLSASLEWSKEPYHVAILRPVQSLGYRSSKVTFDRYP